MLREEFEKLIGRDVSSEEYANANAVYELLSLSKQDFCAIYDDYVKGNPVVAGLSLIGKRIENFRMLRDELLKLIVKHEFTLTWKEVSQEAEKLVGLDLWVKCKLESDAPLSAKERGYLISKL